MIQGSLLYNIIIHIYILIIGYISNKKEWFNVEDIWEEKIVTLRLKIIDLKINAEYIKAIITKKH